MSTEVARCQNHPAVQAGNGIDQLRTELREGIRTLTEAIEARATEEELTTALQEQKIEFTTALQAQKNEFTAALRAQKNEFTTALQATKDEMTALISDCDFNNRARIMNSGAFRREVLLYPLKNTTTHEVVQLPKTLGDLRALQEPAAEKILQDLGQDPARRGKLAQLTQFIGVVNSFAKP
ncbi:hypothetical protein GGR51DRAFT_503345, partial [Nemania sp. FL0031]